MPQVGYLGLSLSSVAVPLEARTHPRGVYNSLMVKLLAVNQNYVSSILACRGPGVW